MRFMQDVEIQAVAMRGIFKAEILVRKTALCLAEAMPLHLDALLLRADALLLQAETKQSQPKMMLF